MSRLFQLKGNSKIELLGFISSDNNNNNNNNNNYYYYYYNNFINNHNVLIQSYDFSHI